MSRPDSPRPRWLRVTILDWAAERWASSAREIRSAVERGSHDRVRRR